MLEIIGTLLVFYVGLKLVEKIPGNSSGLPK